jgi:hypothetical protein
LLPVSQRLDAFNLPSAVLHLIRSIPKTEAFAHGRLELTFQKVIDHDVRAALLHVEFVPELINLLGVGDVAGVVSRCDAMPPRKERTPVLAEVEQLLLYRADLAVRSSVKYPTERFSGLLRSLEVLCCFANLRLFRPERMRIKMDQDLLAPKQKYRAEFSVTVNFGIADHINVEVSDPKFALSWDCPHGRGRRPREARAVVPAVRLAARSEREAGVPGQHQGLRDRRRV